jgi:hypothetical protein
MAAFRFIETTPPELDGFGLLPDCVEDVGIGGAAATFRS